MENKKTFNSLIENLKQQNQVALDNFQESDDKKSDKFRLSMKSIIDNFSTELNDSNTSNVADSLGINIIQTLEEAAGGNSSKEDQSALLETLTELKKAILASSDVDGDEQEILIKYIEQSNATLKRSLGLYPVLLESFKKVGSQALEKTETLTKNAAAFFSDNNPLVTGLTNFVIDGAKNTFMNTRRFVTERKDRKLRIIQAKKDIQDRIKSRQISEDELVVSDETRNNTGDTVKLLEETKETRNNTDNISNKLTDSIDLLKSLAAQRGKELVYQEDQDYDNVVSFLEMQNDELPQSASIQEETMVQISRREPEVKKLSNIESLFGSESESIPDDLLQQIASVVPEIKAEIEKTNENSREQNESSLLDTQDKGEESRDMFENVWEPIIDLLTDIRDQKSGVGDKEEEKGGIVGMLMGLLSGPMGIITAIGAGIVGFAMGFFGVFKDLFSVIGKMFTRAISVVKKSKIGKFISKFFGKIKSVFSGLITMIKNNKVIKSISSIFGKIKSVFSGLITMIKNNKVIKSISSIFGKIINSVKSVFGKISGVFSSLMGKSAIAGKIFKFAKLFGRFTGVLTLIMAAFDGIKGFIQGFKEDGILGGLKGGITEIINGLVGLPLDLLKDAVSWIMEKLGFDGVSEAMDGFSFQTLIGDSIDKVFEVFGSIFDLVKGVFGKLVGVLEKLAKPFKAAGSWLLEKGRSLGIIDTEEEKAEKERKDNIEKTKKLSEKFNDALVNVKDAAASGDSSTYERAKKKLKRITTDLMEADSKNSIDTKTAYENTLNSSEQVYLSKKKETEVLDDSEVSEEKTSQLKEAEKPKISLIEEFFKGIFKASGMADNNIEESIDISNSSSKALMTTLTMDAKREQTSDVKEKATRISSHNNTSNNNSTIANNQNNNTYMSSGMSATAPRISGAF